MCGGPTKTWEWIILDAERGVLNVQGPEFCAEMAYRRENNSFVTVKMSNFARFDHNTRLCWANLLRFHIFMYFDQTHLLKSVKVSADYCTMTWTLLSWHWRCSGPLKKKRVVVRFLCQSTSIPPNTSHYLLGLSLWCVHFKWLIYLTLVIWWSFPVSKNWTSWCSTDVMSTVGVLLLPTGQELNCTQQTEQRQLRPAADFKGLLIMTRTAQPVKTVVWCLLWVCRTKSCDLLGGFTRRHVRFLFG